MADEVQAKRKVTRGRQAPMHTLAESIRFLQQIHQAVGMHPSGRDVLTEALGHKPGSGTGQVKIGALSHFGLLKARRGGTYEITPLAQRILLPHYDVEHLQAISEAAKTPALYGELATQLAGQQVPKLLGNLLARTYGVATKQAEEFAERFRDTMEFAKLLRNGVMHTDPPSVAPGDAADVDAGAGVEDENGSSGAADAHLAHRMPADRRQTGPALATQEYTIPLGRDGKLAIIQVPVPVQEGYLKRIESWAAYMRSVLQDDSGAESQEPVMNQ